jgi:hypothetical protein
MDLDERIRSARPPIDDAAPDEDLLRRVMAQPVTRRRRRPLVAIPVVAVAALIAAAFVLLGGNQPETASALSQAMHWFDPPAGTVLHSRIVNDAGQAREFWQDVDHPENSRTIEPNGLEVGAGAIYDPATNTIYKDDGKRALPSKAKGQDAKKDTSDMARHDAIKQAKLDAEDPGGTETRPAPGRVDKPADEAMPIGDPFVAKVRVLIDDGRAGVKGREVHAGVEAWAISLTAGDRDPWTVWVRADNGKPLAFSDPGDPTRNKAPESGVWETYEKLDRGDAPLTVQAAHPNAKIVTDGAQFDAILQRLESR